MASKSERLETTVEAIRQLNEDWATIRMKQSRQRLWPGASQQAIEAVAGQFGLSRDDPLLQFLALHDGWDNFGPGESILSAADLLGTGKNVNRMRESKQAQIEVGDADAQSGFIIVLGSNNDYCAYLDAKGSLAESRAVVEWDAGGVINRHESFLAFLEFRAVALKDAVGIDRKRRR